MVVDGVDELEVLLESQELAGKRGSFALPAFDTLDTPEASAEPVLVDAKLPVAVLLSEELVTESEVPLVAVKLEVSAEPVPVGAKLLLVAELTPEELASEVLLDAVELEHLRHGLSQTIVPPIGWPNPEISMNSEMLKL